ncbi:hypothetical protein QF000_000271 [Paraburkholderia atlantica]|uniref:Uncharacterized protein n=1 Tax=Paraburkholderia youngii TaxID=2782701 RepID=A0A7W8LHZ4_9BURK|nr:hypothetical protein [Paraburkholderia youngii]
MQRKQYSVEQIVAALKQAERHCQLVGSGTDYCEESIAQETVDGF